MQKWALASWAGVAALAFGLVVGIVQQNARAMLFLGLHLGVVLVAVVASRRPNLLTALFVFAMVLNAPGWGWCWLDVVWRYDELAHLVVTMALTPVVALFLLRPLRAALLERRVVLAVLIFSLGVAGNVLWEIFEWICDHFVTPPGQMSIRDTMTDLISDCIGAVLAIPFGVHALRHAGRSDGSVRGQ